MDDDITDSAKFLSNHDLTRAFVAVALGAKQAWDWHSQTTRHEFEVSELRRVTDEAKLTIVLGRPNPVMLGHKHRPDGARLVKFVLGYDGEGVAVLNFGMIDRFVHELTEKDLVCLLEMFN